MVTILQRFKLFSKILLLAVSLCASNTVSAQIITFNSPLVDAANRGDEASVLLMLSQGYSVNSTGDYGVTPLMRAAYNGHLRIVKVLLGMGADVNATDIAGATALHVAARQGRQDIVEELLRYHANADASDQEGWTPLMRAALAKSPGIVRTLLDNGADPFKVNSAGEYVLMHAVEVGSPEVVQVLVEKGVATRDNPAVVAALGAAVRKDNPEVTQVLGNALTQPLPNTANPVIPVTVKNLPEDTKPSIAERIVNSTEQPSAPTPFPVVSDKPAFAAFEEVKSLEEVLKEEKRIKLLKEKEAQAKLALLQQQKVKSSIPTGKPEAAKTPQNPTQSQVLPEINSSKPLAKTQQPTAPKAQHNLNQATTPIQVTQSQTFQKPVASSKRFFRLQAGMYANSAEAKKAWEMFTTTYPRIFSGQERAVMQLPNQQTETYTLVFGQFPSKQAASRLCSTLWQKDIGCFVMETSLTFDQMEQNTPDTVSVADTATAPTTTPFNVSEALQEEKIQEVASLQIQKPILPPLPAGAMVVKGLPWLKEKRQVVTSIPDATKIGTKQILASGEAMATREELRIAPQEKPIANVHHVTTKNQPPHATKKADIVKKGKVEVAEAIRVQPGQKIALPTAKASAPTTAPSQPQVSQENKKPDLIKTKASPVAITGNVESFWIQVGNFATQKTAVEFAKVIRQNPSFRGTRLRVVRLPAAAAKNEPAIALQLGSFTSERKAASLCKGDLSYLRCTIIREVQSGTKG